MCQSILTPITCTESLFPKSIRTFSSNVYSQLGLWILQLPSIIKMRKKTPCGNSLINDNNSCLFKINFLIFKMVFTALCTGHLMARYCLLIWQEHKDEDLFLIVRFLSTVWLFYRSISSGYTSHGHGLTGKRHKCLPSFAVDGCPHLDFCNLW